ncbi:MAG: leucyl/phenylalanyl-tRNA--protein transferase, partial [Gammaproteobacteria bacterium]|nr:leucyl/phenylalanyl-tRNA--protein transferase [Gammaproteobacteria bacterium]
SLRKTLRRKQYVVTADRAFREVVQACAGPRPHHPLGETWITAKMMDAYCRLHELGYAHSIECWHGDRLAGGLYGVALGRVFFGESMFSHRTDASKVALVYLTRQLMRLKFALIDCQVSSAHLYSLGAKEISRREFMRQLDDAIAENKHPSCDRWTLEPDSSA